MVRGKMFARRLMLGLAILGCGVVTLIGAHEAAGAAVTIGSYAIGR